MYLVAAAVGAVLFGVGIGIYLGTLVYFVAQEVFGMGTDRHGSEWSLEPKTR